MGEDEKKYPREISDWITFLNSVAERGNAILNSISIAGVGLLTASVVFITLTFTIIIQNIPEELKLKSLDLTIQLLLVFVIGGLFLVFLPPFLRKSKRFDYARAEDLLDRIMKGIITNPERVRDEWYGKEEKLMEKWKMLSILAIVVGAILIGVGFFVNNTIIRDFGMLFIPIGIAFFAIHLSEESDRKLVNLGKWSNARLKTIARATFMEIVDIFGDKRIQLLQHPDWLGVEGTIWKSRTYVERALALHRATNIQPELRHRLFKVFYNLIYGTCLPWDYENNTYDAFICDAKGKITKTKVHHIFKPADINNLSLMVGYLRVLGLNPKDLEELDKIEKKIEAFKKKKGWDSSNK